MFLRMNQNNSGGYIHYKSGKIEYFETKNKND
jgi:hypothetical protein